MQSSNRYKPIEALTSTADDKRIFCLDKKANRLSETAFWMLLYQEKLDMFKSLHSKKTVRSYASEYIIF